MNQSRKQQRNRRTNQDRTERKGTNRKPRHERNRPTTNNSKQANIAHKRSEENYDKQHYRSNSGFQINEQSQAQ